MNPLWSSVGSLGTLNFRYAPVVVVVVVVIVDPVVVQTFQ